MCSLACLRTYPLPRRDKLSLPLLLACLLVCQLLVGQELKAKHSAQERDSTRGFSPFPAQPLPRPTRPGCLGASAFHAIVHSSSPPPPPFLLHLQETRRAVRWILGGRPNRSSRATGGWEMKLINGASKSMNAAAHQEHQKKKQRPGRGGDNLAHSRIFQPTAPHKHHTQDVTALQWLVILPSPPQLCPNMQPLKPHALRVGGVAFPGPELGLPAQDCPCRDRLSNCLLQHTRPLYYKYNERATQEPAVAHFPLPLPAHHLSKRPILPFLPVCGGHLAIWADSCHGQSFLIRRLPAVASSTACGPMGLAGCKLSPPIDQPGDKDPFQGSCSEGRAGQGKAGQGKAGQGKARQGRRSSSLNRSPQLHPGHATCEAIESSYYSSNKHQHGRTCALLSAHGRVQSCQSR